MFPNIYYNINFANAYTKKDTYIWIRSPPIQIPLMYLETEHVYTFAKEGMLYHFIGC